MNASSAGMHSDYEKKVFVQIALCMLLISIFAAFYWSIERAVSIFLGFVVVYVCYNQACKQVLEKQFFTDDRSADLNKRFKVLIKASLVRLGWAIFLMGGILFFKKRIPTIPIDSVYLVLGFIVSVIMYRIRVVLGEVSNV
jgi:hypothetical protein